MKSLPREPVDGRPFEDIGRGGTEIVRLLGEIDPSVDPKNEDLILISYIPWITTV